jgi:hypothetical protein
MCRALLILLASALAATACEKQNPTAPGNDRPAERPTVSTGAITGITSTTATVAGQVTADGGAAVTARGVVWSTSPGPTVSDYRTRDGTGTGAFASEIGGLSPEGTYHVRAYATNSAGTAYGEDVSFTTVASKFAIIVLGRVGGYPTLGNALNEDCHVAGSYHRGGNMFGSYVWVPGTGFRDIGLHDASAFAINREGTVAGHTVVGQRDRAYTWSEAGGEQLYYPPSGGVEFTSCYAGAINSHGVIVGSSSVAGSQGTTEVTATLWRPDAGAVALPNNLGGWALARGINDSGVVVGYAGLNPLSGGGMRAAAWLAPDGNPVPLPDSGDGQAWGINNRGDIVGIVGPLAALWRGGGARTLLKALPGHGAATARALTEPDDEDVIHVVGWSEPTWWGPSLERRPVIWTVDGSDVQVAELHPPAGHASAFAKAVKIVRGELVVVGTSYTVDSAFAVMWSTSRSVCGF